MPKIKTPALEAQMAEKMEDLLPGDKPVRWGTIIPLIGGSAIGCYKAAGTYPLFNLSYTPFKPNELHYQNYWPHVPTYRLDSMDTFPHEKFLAGGDIDFINSVCPCAGLSTLNPSRGPDNQANKWMFISAEYVLGNIRPKVLWGENAPGLFLSLGETLIPKLTAYS